MSPIVYLVSGANRGIGLGFISSLASRDNVVIFAGARNPSGAKELQELSKKYPEKVHVIKLLSADKVNNEAAAEEIKKVVGRLDVVIANAGISNFFGLSSLEASPKDMLSHYEINVVGTLVLFQAIYPLLKSSTPTPKFIAISSIGGSIADSAHFPWSTIPYATSKAALNYMARRWHFEFPELTVFPVHPGPVDTDMLNNLLDRIPEGSDLFKYPLITVEESVRGLLREIDNATRESHGGQYLDVSGDRINW